MKNRIFIFLLLFSGTMFSQIVKDKQLKQVDDQSQTAIDSIRRSYKNTSNKDIKNLDAKIEDYKIVGFSNDSTYVDTTLTIAKDNKFNYLRHDKFNLLPFANLGQTYNNLSYNFGDNNDVLPKFGARARHFNYMEVEDINYYYVPTPLTELLYKTAFEQGQLVDAFFTVNTSKQLNFSIAYKGLRSLGKYQHALTSTGNFRFTTNFKTKNNNYHFKGHLVFQDLLNEENGGIADEEIVKFESGDEEFKDRSVFQVNFENAENILEGKRFYLDHYYNLISKKDSISNTNLRFGNIIKFEDKYYQFDQTAANTYFGDAFKTSDLRDKVTLEDFKAQLYLGYLNKTLGQLKFAIGYSDLNYGYNKVVILEDQTVPNRIKGNVFSLEANYKKSIGAFEIWGAAETNIAGDFNGNSIHANARYKLNQEDEVAFGILSNSRMPNYNYLLYQSDYVNYNWYNDYKNVTSQIVSARLKLKKFANVEFNYNTINNYTYFQQTGDESLTKPFQHDQSLNYIKVKLDREFRLGKLALNNTILYQNVLDGEDVLKVPDFVTQNTLYYSNHFFKKALFLQTGITLKYFTKYNMNGYDPLLAEFYVQNDQEFGGFPLLDFFVNAKIRQTRIFLKAEHFNSAFTGYDYYAAPNYPFRDFTVRFGLVWNFFL